jgi:hypothetical protein
MKINIISMRAGEIGLVRIVCRAMIPVGSSLVKHAYPSARDLAPLLSFDRCGVGIHIKAPAAVAPCVLTISNNDIQNTMFGYRYRQMAQDLFFLSSSTT